MRTVWVFGAGRSIGKALVERLLADGERVVAFSRTDPGLSHEGLTFVKVDFQLRHMTRRVICDNFYLRPPAAAAFCQRYRPAGKLTPLEEVQAGVNVELGPLMLLAELLIEQIPMVQVSSVAATRRVDAPVSYHVLKAAALAAARSLGAAEIILEDFQKYPLETYTPKERVRLVDAPTLSEVVDAISTLLDRPPTDGLIGHIQPRLLQMRSTDGPIG